MKDSFWEVFAFLALALAIVGLLALFVTACSPVYSPSDRAEMACVTEADAGPSRSRQVVYDQIEACRAAARDGGVK